MSVMYVISQENRLYFYEIIMPERKLHFQNMLEDFCLSLWFLSRIKKNPSEKKETLSFF